MSLYLIEQADLLKTDIAFIDEELTSLDDSITDLSESRSQLGLNKEKYKNQLISNSYKLESLKSKKKINAQIQSVSSFQMDSNTPLDKLKLQVMKAQAELEVIKNKSNPFEAKRDENRKLRQANKYKDHFEKLKRSREALV
jgi:phage shock protein A